MTVNEPAMVDELGKTARLTVWGLPPTPIGLLPENPKDREARSQGRVAFHVCPPVAKVYWALAMMEGAEKYGALNWQTIPIDETVYTDAIERHLTALQAGEWIDRDSGLPHAAKIMATASIMLDAWEHGMLRRRQADKPPYAANRIWNAAHKEGKDDGKAG